MINIKEHAELNVLNHSGAHLMAQAVKRLYPQAMFWVGPVIAEGFYYDIDLDNEVIKEEDLEKIEKEMKKISKDGKRIVRNELSKLEALEKFKDDPALLNQKTKEAQDKIASNPMALDNVPLPTIKTQQDIAVNQQESNNQRSR